MGKRLTKSYSWLRRYGQSTAAGKAGAPLFRDVGADRLPMLPWMTLDPAPAHTGAINGLIKSICDTRRGKRRGEMEDFRRVGPGMSLIKTHSMGETCMRFSNNKIAQEKLVFQGRTHV